MVDASQSNVPEINLSTMSRANKVKLAALIAQFAPQSAVYTANPAMKAAADAVVAAGPDLAAKTSDTNSKKQAFLTSVSARSASEQALDNAVEVFKSNAATYCKSEADLTSLGVARKPTKAEKGPPPPLVPPTLVTATAGKQKGTVDARATRIAGLNKYIVGLSTTNAVGSFVVQPGTASRRTLSGLVSGQQYWLQYCTERGQLRSAWSDPIPVIAR
jgi:hypothetical protein